MHEHEHDHTGTGSLRPKAARLDEPDALAVRAALSGRLDAMGPRGMLGLQRAVGNAGVTAALEEERSPVHDVVGSPGAPLDRDVREDMEGRLGHDFSDVRVHTDGAADASAKAVNAHAYTVGSNIAFQRSAYDPGSRGGPHDAGPRTDPRRPAAQRPGRRHADRGRGVKVSDPSDRFEREAAATAERAVAGPVPVQTRGGVRPRSSSGRRRKKSRSRARSCSASPSSARRSRPRRSRPADADRTAAVTSERPAPHATPERALRRGPRGGAPPCPDAPDRRVSLLALQRAAGNAAVSALMAGRFRSPGAQAVADIDAALSEFRRDEPVLETVDKGLQAAKAAGVSVVEDEGPKPPASALAVTTTGFGPGSVPAKKPVPPPKPVPAVSPLGKAAAKRAKPAGGGRGAARGGAPGSGAGTGRGGTGVRRRCRRTSSCTRRSPPTRTSPERDPAFTRVTGAVKGVAKAKRAHPPAASKAKEAQDAALAPADDLGGQAKAAKADTMDAQQAGHVRQEGVHRRGEDGDRGEVAQDAEGGRRLQGLGQGERGQGRGHGHGQAGATRARPVTSRPRRRRRRTSRRRSRSRSRRWARSSRGRRCRSPRPGPCRSRRHPSS